MGEIVNLDEHRRRKHGMCIEGKVDLDAYRRALAKLDETLANEIPPRVRTGDTVFIREPDGNFREMSIYDLIQGPDAET